MESLNQKSNEKCFVRGQSKVNGMVIVKRLLMKDISLRVSLMSFRSSSMYPKFIYLY